MLTWLKLRLNVNTVWVSVAFIALFFCYYLIVGSFFPNRQQTVGHDYALGLPYLLDSYFWFRNNPFFTMPWFSPAFCGGISTFAEGSSYYSLPVVLTFIFDPLTSAFLSILLFAAAGFWGMYTVLRRLFETSTLAAFMGTALFLFNGFYLHRMIVGHLGYQAFMLLPWVVFFLLYQPRVSADPTQSGKANFILYSLLAGIMVALIYHSGFTTLMIPSMLAVLAMSAMYLLHHNAWSLLIARSVLAIPLALALSAAKLNAQAAFMSHFPRDDYSLAGIAGIGNALQVLFTTLFISPADIEEIAVPKLVHMQWLLQRHEWEFGVTPIPLVIIAVSWVYRIFNRPKSDSPSPKISLNQILTASVLAVTLIVPLAINTYYPSWNALLKHLPLLGNSSTLFRWWIIYIPVVIVYAALALDKITCQEPYKKALAIGSVLVLVLLNATQNREFYHDEPYDPSVITQAYVQTKNGAMIPEIKFIGAFTNSQGKIEMPINRNDTLVNGISQLACYDPSFGYRLEHLPIKTLHPGSIYENTNGYLNLKNPACYVFPLENICRPGDHFEAYQLNEAKAFAHYKPFPFKISARQAVANALTLISLIGCAVVLTIYAIGLAVPKRH